MIKSLNFNLRPHHSLCIQFFEGMGYNEEFIKHMTKTIESLNKENPIITLTNSCDEICSSCPNNKGGICDENEKVRCIDNRCIFEYGLKYGDTIKWSELKALAFKKIIFPKNLKHICKDCQWQCKND